MKSYEIIIVSVVASIIMKLSIKMMYAYLRGDFDFPTLPKISLPKITLPKITLPKRKKEEKENYDLPDKQKDFIQLN